MKRFISYQRLRTLYIATLLIACYALLLMPFSFSYFTSNHLSFGANKTLCLMIMNESLPFTSSLLSVAEHFHAFMNSNNPAASQLDPDCPTTWNPRF